jgi:ADP-ribosylglycohydrolase
MRAAPIGLIFSRQPDRLIEVSRAVAICTHAHPTGISSAIAAAAAVAYAVEGKPPDGLLAHLKNVLCFSRNTEVVNHDPLHEQLNRLDDAQRALALPPDQAFEVVGGGWVGEEAVAGACYAYLRDPRSYANAVLIGANAAQPSEATPSRGRCDSDSIACIAGSISGAALGLEAVPKHWVDAIENRDLLLATADALWAKAESRRGR